MCVCVCVCVRVYIYAGACVNVLDISISCVQIACPSLISRPIPTLHISRLDRDLVGFLGVVVADLEID